MKRSPMPARTKPMSRSQLRRLAVKAQRPKDTGPPPSTRRTVRRRSRRRCELALPGCWLRATQFCHRLGRKAGGRHGWMRVLTNGAAWGLDGCGWCHGLTTSAEEPLLSQYRAAGLLLVEGQDARLVAVQVRWSAAPVLLDDAGGWSVAA